MLKKAALKENAFDTMSWTNISTDAVSEYRKHSNIFYWHFLGYFQVVLVTSKMIMVSANQWERNMLLYFHGRFATDKMFCFFALNFMI